MKLRLFALLTVAALSACTNSYPEEELVFNPDYNRIARNVTVVSKSPKYVTYEYKNIRVDEIAAVAAQYCYDRGQKQASLYEIIPAARPSYAGKFPKAAFDNLQYMPILPI